VRRLHRPGDIGRAVASVPIIDVLASLGVIVEAAPLPGTTQKIWCPFSDLHPDGGRQREMRLYSDGKAHCHICVKQYDSVSMAAQAWGVSQRIAAQRLLEGQEVITERQAVRSLYVVRAGAVAALGVWADRVGIDRFGLEYRRCLALADHIQEPGHVKLWLAASKQFLRG
jgi:hypothetical protein